MTSSATSSTVLNCSVSSAWVAFRVSGEVGGLPVGADAVHGCGPQLLDRASNLFSGVYTILNIDGIVHTLNTLNTLNTLSEGGGGGRLIALVHLLPGGRVIDRSGPTFVFTPNGARSCPFFAPREWLPVPPEVSPRRILHFRQRPVDLLRGQDARIVTLCEDTTGCPRGAALRLVGWSLTRVRRWWRVEFPGPCGMNYPECLMAGFLWLCTSSCAKRGS